jgi:hypothetical protein
MSALNLSLPARPPRGIKLAWAAWRFPETNMAEIAAKLVPEIPEVSCTPFWFALAYAYDILLIFF